MTKAEFAKLPVFKKIPRNKKSDYSKNFPGKRFQSGILACPHLPQFRADIS
jgi:hypothetical protein